MLLWGDEAGLNALASFLLELGAGDSAALTEQPWVRLRGALSVTIALSAEPLGLAQARETPPDLRWSLSPALVQDYAQKIRVVERSEKPGHHYLETGADEAAVVVVSKGEHDGLQAE